MSVLHYGSVSRCQRTIFRSFVLLMHSERAVLSLPYACTRIQLVFDAANVVCANTVARFMFRAVIMLASVQSMISF